MKPAVPSLADQLRQAIRDTGQSLAQLGKAAGLDSGRLSRFMRGERDLSLSGAARLCQVLHLHLVRDGNGAAEGAPCSQIDHAAFRRAQARALAEAVAALERDAKREDFSACAYSLFSRLKETIAALTDAPREEDACEVFRQLRNTHLNGGWDRYRSRKVRRIVTGILNYLARAEEVTPDDVKAAFDKLLAAGLNPVGAPLPELEGEDEDGDAQGN
jgi:transcriptional regulator with XRE-family HTH domain